MKLKNKNNISNIYLQKDMGAWITKPPKKKREYVPQGNRSMKYYNQTLWHRLRDDYIAHHPLCERCLSKGRTTAAEHVHHVTPFMQGKGDRERMELLLDPHNLMALCADCHRFMHAVISYEVRDLRGMRVQVGKVPTEEDVNNHAKTPENPQLTDPQPVTGERKTRGGG